MIKTCIPKVSGATDYRKFGYILVKPSSMPSGTVPILIVGHGAGEKGDGTCTSAGLTGTTGPEGWSGFTGLQRSVDHFKFVIIHIQTSSNYQYGEIQAGVAFAKTFSYCDPNNIHYYGVSLGGYGFYYNAGQTTTGQAFVSNFASITLAAPGCCPSGNDQAGINIGKSGRPIWILHCHNDCIVNISNSTTRYNKIIANGGKAWISVWKDRSCPSPGTICSTQCAHDMVSFIVGESWNEPDSTYPTYNLLPTYSLNSGHGIREISSGTLAKMSVMQWIKSNKKGSAIVPPYNTYGGTPTNQPPTANAGSDKSITLPTNSVTLTATGSDPEGNSLTYAWSKISGPSSYNIQSPSTASTVVSNLVQGTYTFRVTVKDSGGLTDTDDVNVLVNPAPPPPTNEGPIAKAGADQTITLPTNTATLSGTTSYDPDGTTLTYSWTKVSGPAATITNANSAIATLTNLVEGTYTYRLTVTDSGGAKGSDDVIITVNPAPVVIKNVLAVFEVYSDGTVTKIGP